VAEEPMILLDVNPSRENTMMMYSAAGVTPRIRFRTTDYEVTRSLVARGMGYAILVQLPAGSQSYEGRELVVKPIHPAPRRVDVSLVWPEAVQSSQCARALVALARELYADELPVS
jgi:Transcriptional regulator